jgi:hypothetical protein
LVHEVHRTAATAFEFCSRSLGSHTCHFTQRRNVRVPFPVRDSRGFPVPV